MSVIEIIEFTTHEHVTSEALTEALDALDTELKTIGGFQSRQLFRDAVNANSWILDYRWDSVEDAQSSMMKVSETPVFGQLMTLVSNPETMRMLYGTPNLVPTP